MKTQAELNAIKKEFENLNKKLEELSEEELKQVAGGAPRLTIRQAATMPTYIASLAAQGGKRLVDSASVSLQEVVNPGSISEQR